MDTYVKVDRREDTRLTGDELRGQCDLRSSQYRSPGVILLEIPKMLEEDLPGSDTPAPYGTLVDTQSLREQSVAARSTDDILQQLQPATTKFATKLLRQKIQHVHDRTRYRPRVDCRLLNTFRIKMQTSPGSQHVHPFALGHVAGKAEGT